MPIETPETAPLQALRVWLDAARHTSPRLDDNADALLAMLHQTEAALRQLNYAAAQPPVLGLYGQSQAGKHHLLRALLGGEQERIAIPLADTPLDYFSHITPEGAALPIAVRLSPSTQKAAPGFPVTLRMLSEAGLVQLMLAHASATGDASLPPPSQCDRQLARLCELCQPRPLPGIDAADIAQIAERWRARHPARHHDAEALWQQLAEIVPRLDLAGRSRAWSLLWSESPTLTQYWLTLANTLQRLEYATTVLAPQSLLTDSFALPTDGFLRPAALPDDTQDEVLICPITSDGVQAAAVTVPLAQLVMLCVELVVPVIPGPLGAVDIVDIPGDGPGDGGALAQTKRRWMLDDYRQRQQPDLLLVCHAAPSRQAIPTVAHRLLGWVEHTQPAHDAAQPRLAWAITPHDGRFNGSNALDERVQQLIGRPGQRWGVLQALSEANRQPLYEWLQQALTEEHHAARIAALRHGQYQRLRQAFRHFSQPLDAAEAEATVRALQRIAPRHGELLAALLLTALPPVSAAQSIRPEKPQAPFALTVDLFAAPTEAADTHTDTTAQGTDELHKAWVNAVRRWTQCPRNAAAFGLEPAALQQTGEMLVTIGYRLDLSARLAAAPPGDAAQQAALSDFLTWLGYDSVPPDARPASRIAPDSAIFAPSPPPQTRLTRLGEQPQHAATHYVYDWLVALYTRAMENATSPHPLDLRVEDRVALGALLDRLA